jgi:hypothetical protein
MLHSEAFWTLIKLVSRSDLFFPRRILDRSVFQEEFYWSYRKTLCVLTEQILCANSMEQGPTWEGTVAQGMEKSPQFKELGYSF